MTYGHLTLNRRVQRAERTVCPTRIYSVMFWDRGDYIEAWGLHNVPDDYELPDVGKPIVPWPRSAARADPASPSAKRP